MGRIIVVMRGTTVFHFLDLTSAGVGMLCFKVRQIVNTLNIYLLQFNYRSGFCCVICKY